MNRGRAAFATGLVLLLIGATPVLAETPEEEKQRVEQQVADLARQISAQEGQRSAVQSEIAVSQQRMSALRAELSEAQARLAQVESEIATASSELTRIELEIEGLQRELALTRVGIRETRLDIRAQAVALYVKGTAEVQLALFLQDEISELVVGLSYARDVVDESGALINALEVLKRQEERREEDLVGEQVDARRLRVVLEGRRLALDREKRSIEAAEAEVQAELSRQRDLLDRIQRQIDEYESEKAHAEEELVRIEREIRARSTGTGQEPGQLSWPINSAVTSSFGYRIHPILGISRLHTGIDLRAAHGTQIRAAGAGTIILATTYGGYGKTVVVDHGGGLTSLYAHLSALAVSEGESISVGGVIGRAGSTGLSTGAHLHFETRVNGVPVDPMGYLS